MMESATKLDPSAMEEWVLSQIGTDTPDFATVLNTLSRLRSKDPKTTLSLAELVQEKAAKTGSHPAAIRAYQLRVACGTAKPTSRDEASATVLDILGNTPENRALVKNVGFDQRIPLDECFRRLLLLLSLHEGLLCYDKTWGCGVVKAIDHFYERVEIDFTRKRDHEMSFAYAAETLALLSDDHLLARKHKDPKALMQLVEEQPGEIIKITLRSYGPLSVPLLQEALVRDLLPEKDWKKFWDAARKALKKDNTVIIPSKRTESVVLLDKALAYDDDWFEALGKERDMKRILELVDEFIDAAEDALTPGQAEIVDNRLSFVVTGAGRKYPGLSARAMMDAQELKIQDATLDIDQLADWFMEEENFLGALSELPAREQNPFLDRLIQHSEEKAIPLILSVLPRLDASLVAPCVERLKAAGREDAVCSLMRGLVARRELPVDLIAFLWRNLDLLDTWKLCETGELMESTLNAVEDVAGDRTRTRNQLKERFRAPDWLASVLPRLSAKEKERLIQRIRESSAWPEIERRSVLGQIIKICPELERLMSGKKREQQTETVPTQLTSHRSYRERQAQLERIINVEIPQNSKEIGVARSYGDLRENFEYHAAKDAQGLLMRRRDELQQMLAEVSPTDFADFPGDRAGLASSVTLAYADGRREIYHILGVWDGDPELGIISCKTRMATVLEGKQAGEEVAIPAEHGEISARIETVSPLPDHIRQWIVG